MDWIIDIIEHFSKYMLSYPIEKLEADNSLICLKTFCTKFGYPNILQSDKRAEFINEKKLKNSMKIIKLNIFSSPITQKLKKW